MNFAKNQRRQQMGYGKFKNLFHTLLKLIWNQKAVGDYNDPLGKSVQYLPVVLLFPDSSFGAVYFRLMPLSLWDGKSRSFRNSPANIKLFT